MLAYICASIFFKGGFSLKDEFLHEAAKFRRWAGPQRKRYGEWETEYYDWSEIYHAAEVLLAGDPVDQWDDELKDEFLYILARDNECENILDTLIQSPDHLIALAGHAVTFLDSDARWQIAYGLGQIEAYTLERRKLLNVFINDKDEYVRRRARLAWEVSGF